MDSSADSTTKSAPAAVPARPHLQLPLSERTRRRITAYLTRLSPRLFAIDGALVAIAGLFAIQASIGTFQGEGFLLVFGGGALVLFGLMMILRWNLPAARTGLIGLTAGYFATALTEFQVATDPCDIGAKFARCAGAPVLGAPWIVYQGPLILAMLLFVFIALEPFLPEAAEAADPDLVGPSDAVAQVGHAVTLYD
jgi:hypothetical protein